MPASDSVHITWDIPAHVAEVTEINFSMTPRSMRTASANTTTNEGNMNDAGNMMRNTQITPLRFEQPATTSGSHVVSAATGWDDNVNPFIVVDPPPVHIPGPDPIYPLQPGQTILPTLARLDPNRSHGFYIIFKGLKIGIFYTYWCDVLSINIHSIYLIQHTGLKSSLC